MNSRSRAQITWYNNRAPLHGSTGVAGDEWLLFLRINDVELGSPTSLKFTAKSFLEDSDDVAEIALGIGTGITLLPSSSANRIDARIVVPTVKTEAIDVPIPPGRVQLFFDVQLNRSGTPAIAAKVQTYFRQENASFFVIGDVTNVNA